MGICTSQRELPREKTVAESIANVTNISEDIPSDTSNDDASGNDFLFFIEMESDSDEVKLDPVEEGYPAPKPTESHASYVKRLAKGISYQRIDGKKEENENKIPSEDEFTDVKTDAIKDRFPVLTPKEPAKLQKTGKGLTKVYQQHRNQVEKDKNILPPMVEIDNHSRNAPADVSKSFRELIRFLELPFKHSQERNTLLVRAILVWLSNQDIEGRTTSSSEADTDSPSGYLDMLSANRTTHSTFFTQLCRSGGIFCAQIHGVSKAGDYQPGDHDENQFRCLWNAVYLNNAWHIVHPFWVCRSVFGKVSGGWIKIEEGGKAIGKRLVESSGILRNSFQDYYIMPDPSQFLYACHPDDAKWQLVKKPITRTEFFEQSYLLPPFWEFGMELKSIDECSLYSKNGEVSISFSTSKKIANELDVWYELLLKENTSGAESELLKPENIPKLVTPIRNTPEWNCSIQFPAEGIYKIVFYCGKFKNQMLRVAEFLVVCKKRCKICRPLPFDPGRLAIGPGPAAEDAGLLLPSHRNGLVTVQNSQEILLRFILDSDISELIFVKIELFTFAPDTDEETRSEKNKYVSYSISKMGFLTSAKELRISADVREVGDCFLQISTGIRSNEQEQTLENIPVVCNYQLRVADDPVKKFKYGSKYYARRHLLAAIEGDSIEDIEKWLVECKKANIKDDDSDIEYARSKLEFLRLRKAIYEAKQRRNLGITLQVIEQLKASKFERIYRRDIHVLERFAAKLRELNGFTQEMPRLMEALLELNNRPKSHKAVRNVLTSFLLLYGEHIDKKLDFRDIQFYSRQFYGKVLVHQQLNEWNARRAKEELDKYPKDETRAGTMAATKMHGWIKEVTTSVLKSHGEES